MLVLQPHCIGWWKVPLSDEDLRDCLTAVYVKYHTNIDPDRHRDSIQLSRFEG